MMMEDDDDDDDDDSVKDPKEVAAQSVQVRHRSGSNLGNMTSVDFVTMLETLRRTRPAHDVPPKSS